MCGRAGAQGAPAAMGHVSQEWVTPIVSAVGRCGPSAAVAGDLSSPGEPAKYPWDSHGTHAQVHPRLVPTSTAV